MKKRIVLWIALAMLLSLGAILSVSAESSQDIIHVTINGNEVAFSDDLGRPYVDSAWRTQVPVRATMEAYGAYVSWDTSAHTAIVQYRDSSVRIPIGQNYLMRNRQIRAMDTKALILKDRTYLPIRFVVEALGGTVSWDQSTLTVNIQNPSYPYKQTAPGTEQTPGAYNAYQNALLIGDSRTQGIQLAAGITGADFFCENSLSLRKVMSGGRVSNGTYTITEETDEFGNVTQNKVANTVTLEEQLRSKQYSRVYILLGFNDAGWRQPGTFENLYDQLIRQVRDAQPNAMVIAEKLVPVTSACSQTNQNYNNPAVAQHNVIIERLARNHSILCVDPSWAVADETGALAAGYSGDGIHLNGTGYKLWAQYVGRIVP